MNLPLAHDQSAAMAQFLVRLRYIRAGVKDLHGEPCPTDASDMAERHEAIFEALAEYVEDELRRLQRHMGADLARHPKADMAPAGVHAAIVDTWRDFVRPSFQTAQEYLQDYTEYTDLMQQHGLGKQQMGLR